VNNEENELKIHILQSELTQVLERIKAKHDDLNSMEQVHEYLSHLINTLQFFHQRGDYKRMEYDLCHALAFLPMAFPINLDDVGEF
tara:strand:- start:2382 stop:2639 length:258 start_codon:yes stop_codon:yes gene_type:complete